MTNAPISSLDLFPFFFQQTDSLYSSIKQPQSYLKSQKIEITFNLEILFYIVFIDTIEKVHLFKSSLPEMFYKVLLKILQNSMENTYAKVSFIIMLAVASVPCQEYIKDKILNHAPPFLSSNSVFFLFSFAIFCILFTNILFLLFYLKFLYCICIVVLILEAYSEPCHTSKMEFFV